MEFRIQKIGLPIMILAFFIYNSVHAQSVLGYDNFSPLIAASRNPAHLADSRLRGEIGVFGSFFSSETNLASTFENYNFHPDHIFNLVHFETGPSLNEISLSSNSQNSLVELNAQLAGFMSLGDQFAVGTSFRQRASINHINYDRNLFSGLSNGFANQNQSFSLSNFKVAAHYWEEYALSGAVQVIESRYKYALKFGGALKLTRGLGFAQLDGVNEMLTGSFDAANNTLSLNSGQLRYMQSFSENNATLGDFRANQGGSLGLSGDFGISAEFRTRETAYNGATAKNNKAKNKYLVKVSASILDIGKIKYLNVANDTITIVNTVEFDVPVANTNNLKTNSTNLRNQLEIESSTNPTNVIYNKQNNSGELNVALPTSFLIEGDFRITPVAYMNINYRGSLQDGNALFNTSRAQLLNATLRYETKNFAAYLPISFDMDNKLFGVGVGFRFVPIRIGTLVLGDQNQVEVSATIPFYEDWDQVYRSRGNYHRKRRRFKRRR